LLGLAIFNLGAYNFSFVLLRASDLGVAKDFIPIVFATINIAHTFDAISKIKDMKSIHSPMRTQIETNNFANILNGIEAAHQAVESIDAKRIISTIRID
jgi:uncharacterized protein YqgV (UPF0045/DUF77 family)